MRPSPKTTQYITIHEKHGSSDVNLYFNRHQIRQQEEGYFIILGIPINKDGTASTWLQQLKQQWKPMEHLIKRLTHHSIGAGTDCEVARRLTVAVLIAKIRYGAPYYYDLTAANYKQLEKPHTMAISGQSPAYQYMQEQKSCTDIPASRR